MKNSKNKIFATYFVAVLLIATSIVIGLLLGSVKLDLSEIFTSLFRFDTEGTTGRILFYVRIPRVAASLICGAALAVSGAVIQGVLANRLASPSIIGVNSGAGLAVTLCSAFGILGGFELSLFAFLGAFSTVLLVSIGAKRFGASRGTVILIGVALNALLGAISDTVTALNPEISVMSNDFRIGDFSYVTYERLLPASIIVVISLAVLFTLANRLDVLSLGDDRAKGLGMNVSFTRVVFLLLSALLAASAVSVAGLISFVGLLIPHAVRRVATAESRHLLPLSALLGAGFVSACDTLARIVFAPFELPVGIIMAFIGAPFFVFILIKGKGGHARD